MDVDERKVAKSLDRGVPAVCLDAADLAPFADNACRVISMVHFLEHLPTFTYVDQVIAEAARTASETIFVRGPCFHDDYLAAKGLRFCWSHWRGHPTHVEAADVECALRRAGVVELTTTYLMPVTSSDDDCVHSLQSAVDRFAYDASVDPPKPKNVPLVGLYQQFEIVATVPQLRPATSL